MSDTLKRPPRAAAAGLAGGVEFAEGAFAALLIAVVCAIAIKMIPLGYGNGDEIGMLKSWQSLTQDGVYAPSRFQGYLVPEIMSGFLAERFGPVGSNTAAFLVAAFAVALFYALVRESSDEKAAIAASLVIVANPYWMLASMSTQDYAYSMAFELVGIWLYRQDLRLLSILAFAFGTGARLTFFPVGLAFCIWTIWRAPGARRVPAIEALVIYLAFCCLFYVPVFIASHMTLRFLDAAQPLHNDLLARTARFLWKSVSFFGLPAFVVLCIAIVPTIVKRRGTLKSLAAGAALCLILFDLVVFFLLPANPAYLFPALFGLAFLLAHLRANRAMVYLVCVTELLAGFWRPDVLKIDYVANEPCKATEPLAAHLTFYVGEGPLLDYVRKLPKSSCVFDERGVDKARFHYDRIYEGQP